MKIKKISLIVLLSLILTLLIYLKLFTGVLGKPCFVKVYQGDGNGKVWHAAGKVKDIEVIPADNSSLKSIKYCENLEQLVIVHNSKIGPELDIELINNPNLKTMYIDSRCSDWSGLNKCTRLEYLRISGDILGGYSDFSNFHDISDLTKLKSLSIETASQLNYDGIENLISLEDLTICSFKMVIDCEYLSRLENLRSMCIIVDDWVYPDNDEAPTVINIESLSDMKNLTELKLSHLSETDDYHFLTDIPNLKKLTLLDDTLPPDVERALTDKGIEVIQK